MAICRLALSFQAARSPGATDWTSRHRFGRHQKGREDARQPGQFHRRARRFGICQRQRRERPFHRMDQIQRRIGNRPRRSEVKTLSAANQHRRFGHCGVALVGQLQSHRPRRRNQHARCGNALPETRLCRQQNRQFSNLYRPAVAQRIDGQRRAPGRMRRAHARAQDTVCAQRTNSVTRGIWSLGCSQRRVSSTKWCPLACCASSGEAHI